MCACPLSIVEVECLACWTMKLAHTTFASITSVIKYGQKSAKSLKSNHMNPIYYSWTLLRVAAVIRRSAPMADSNTSKLGEISLDRDQHTVMCRDEFVDLRARSGPSRQVWLEVSLAMPVDVGLQVPWKESLRFRELQDREKEKSCRSTRSSGGKTGRKWAKSQRKARKISSAHSTDRKHWHRKMTFYIIVML